MHRSITAFIAAGLLLLAMAMPAAAAKPEATGPACADILPEGVSAGYTTEAGTPTVSMLFELHAPSCKNVRYAAFVYEATGTTLLASGYVAGTGDASNEIGLLIPVPDGPSQVCVYAATQASGGTIFDRAPDGDDTCVVLDLEGGAGQRKFG